MGVCLKQEGNWNGQLTARRPGGTTFQVNLSAHVVKDDQDKPLCLMASCMDITERILAEEAMHVAKVAAEEAVLTRDRFLASMSHELRTPLNGVLGFSELLSEQFNGDLNERQLTYVHHIQDSADHLLNLVNDLLDIAKVDSGAMEVHREELSSRDLVSGPVDLMKTQFQDKRVYVETVTDPALTAVFVDRRKYNQILFNLLSNAAKYSPRGSTVTVCATRSSEETLRVSVRDMGPGVPLEYQEMIFSEFHQIDQKRDSNLGGTRIGLALTRRLVELQGGSIGVDSDGNSGSVFWFTLPLAPLDADGDTGRVEPESPDNFSEANPSTGRRILLAEDNESIVAVMLETLRIHNHDVVVAKNGIEAVDLAQQHHPELILMDLAMPLMSGMEAVKELRALSAFSETPIVALSASAEREIVEECVLAGFTHHLSKPVAMKDLFALLHECLETDAH